MESKQWNCIIANPPYGAIGANITDYIRQNIDYDLYVNLLPANDYKRNKTKDLFNYQNDMTPINDGFEDAAVTTHVARIYKNKVNNMTLDEFELNNYIDKSLDKYFRINNVRTTYLDLSYNAHGNCTYENASNVDTICFGEREFSHHHLPFGKNVNSYKWNVEKSINKLTVDCAGKCRYIFIKFNSSQEKDNCINFIYSEKGFRFISKLFTAMNKDGYDVGNFLPKVDWTRPWTVEELLTDYGYTDDEVKEVIVDLDNFNGIED